MARSERNRPTKISVTACPLCLDVLEPLPGGRRCVSCDVPTITALVILPRRDASIEQAADLLRDVLSRMAAMATR